jgi:hypothetical protein
LICLGPQNLKINHQNNIYSKTSFAEMQKNYSVERRQSNNTVQVFRIDLGFAFLYSQVDAAAESAEGTRGARLNTSCIYAIARVVMS